MISVPVIKFTAQLVASLGVSKVVLDVVKNNVSIVTNADAAKVWVGSIVIGSLAVEQASNFAGRTVDDVVGWMENRKSETPSPEVVA